MREANEPGLIHLEVSSLQGMNQASKALPEEWDSGTSDHNSESRLVLMGKLCRRALVLIKYKVGADKAVDDYMVKALEAWLWKRGISIYTDRFL
jgi:hypothetical protein